jgi:hypothetical protein
MSPTVTFCVRCGSALSEGSAFCMVCGAPAVAPGYGPPMPGGSAPSGPPGQVGPPPPGAPGPATSGAPEQATTPADSPFYPGAPPTPGFSGVPYLRGPNARPGAASGASRPVAILMIALGSIALVVALIGALFVMVSGNGGGVSVTPESFSCAGGASRAIEFTLPDLTQTTKLTITITNDKGSGVSSYTASVSDLSQYLQADGHYRIQDSGDSGAECSSGAGTYTYAIWNDDTKEKLLSGTFTVLP